MMILAGADGDQVIYWEWSRSRVGWIGDRDSHSVLGCWWLIMGCVAHEVMAFIGSPELSHVLRG